jgi:hypothetical protein
VSVLHFEAIGADLFARVGEYGMSNPGLTYKVRPGLGQTVELATEEKFRDLPGSVTVLPDTERPQEEQAKTGALHYFEHVSGEIIEPAQYNIRVYLPQAQFDQLLSAAQRGRLPSEISVYVLGMNSIPWVPDTSSFEWNNKSSPRLPLGSVQFHVPLIAESSTASSHAHVDELSQRIDRIGMEIKGSLKPLLYVILLLGVLILILK